MFSSPSARARPVVASSANPMAAVIVFQFMVLTPIIVGSVSFPADEEKQRDDRDRKQQEGGRYRVDLRRDAAADLAEHVGRQRVLAARFDELGDEDVIE